MKMEGIVLGGGTYAQGSLAAINSVSIARARAIKIPTAIKAPPGFSKTLLETGAAASDGYAKSTTMVFDGIKITTEIEAGQGFFEAKASTSEIVEQEQMAISESFAISFTGEEARARTFIGEEAWGRFWGAGTHAFGEAKTGELSTLVGVT
jgi:hypothetical protein